MQIVKLNKSVRGASHKPDGICQDSNLIQLLDGELYVIAVADGHGSPICKYSHIGSDIAVKCFFDLIETLYNKVEGDMWKLSESLNANGADKLIKYFHKFWLKEIELSYENMIKEGTEAEVEKFDPELYGTTFLGLIVGKEFVYALQIGDGDIVFVEGDQFHHVIDPPKFLGTETYSLSNQEPWNNAATYFQRMTFFEKAPCLFMVFSDGFSNSFVDDQQFEIACIDYLRTLQQYGEEAVQENLEQWLDETSTEGCGDDITLVALGAVDDQMIDVTANNESDADAENDQEQITTAEDGNVQEEKEIINTEVKDDAVEKKSE